MPDGKKAMREKAAPRKERDAAAAEGIRLAFLIHDVSRMRRNAYDQLIKPLGVTRARWWVLAHLSRQDGIMQTQLADVLDVGKASLGTLLERLEEGHWIERRADPVDKRAKRVFLTRSAQQLLRRLTAEEDRFNASILKNLGARDRQYLIQGLTSIKKALAEFDTPDSDGEVV